MRDALKDLISKSVIFKFKLPFNDIEKSVLTNKNDFCFESLTDESLSSVIYNGIIDYSLSEKDVNFGDLQNEQLRAIKLYLRYEENDDEETQLKYGFFGEVMLNLILQHFFGTSVLIAKGYFYAPIDGHEAHGFDQFHTYYNREKDKTTVVLGESKFHANKTNGIESVIKGIDKALSINYLNRNFYSIFKFNRYCSYIPERIHHLFEELTKNPELNVYDFLTINNIDLAYPVLIMCNKDKTTYEEQIRSIIDSIKYFVNKYNPNISINVSVFFLIMPVNNSKQVKKSVLKWISEKKPVL